jgi:hypothetical protein
VTHPRTSRVHALAFNALTKALGDADVFVRLSDRENITAAVVTAVGDEIARRISEKIGYGNLNDREIGLNWASRIASPPRPRGDQ